MSKVVLYIAASVDGYIADKDGGVGWLEAFQQEGEDYGYAAFSATVGAVIMGTATYEQVLTFGPWPYTGMETHIFTHQTGLPRPDESVHFYSGEPGDLVRDLKGRIEKDIWLVGGGKLVTGFANANLIDEYRVFTMPLLLGDGIPLYHPFEPGFHLKLIDHHVYPDGVVMLRYQPAA